jgi:hypothetical protein
VGQDAGRRGDADPSHRIHLVTRRRVAGDRPHQPVADHLVPALAIDVGRRAQLLAERAAQPGLLLDLPQRRVLVRLAGVQLPLGQCPVVVAGPVDEQELGRAGVVEAGDEPAGGLDGPGGRAQLQARFPLVSSAAQASGNSALASRLRSRSRSISRPAARCASGLPSRSSRARMRSSATTAS